MKEHHWRNLVLTCVVGMLSCVSQTFAAESLTEQLTTGGSGAALDPQTQERGSQLYKQRCAACHESGGASRAPGGVMLRMMPAQSIYRSLTEGVMKDVVPDLSNDDRRMVAEVLAQRPMSLGAPAPLMCAKEKAAFDFNEPPPFSGWGLGNGNDHAIAPAVARLGAADLEHLELKWAFAFPNAVRARSQPTFGGGALYVGSHDGSVFALDWRTGCARWIFQASAEVRNAIVISSWRRGDRSAQPTLFFGDLVGNVYALDALSGAQRWKIKADQHPHATITGSPTLFEDKLLVAVSSLEEGASANPRYECCTFRGSLIAYDARTGAKLWQSFTVEPATERGVNAAGVRRFGPSGVAIWSAPTVDAKRRLAYVTTGDNYSHPVTTLSDAVLAFDLQSGQLKWTYQATAGDAWNVGCVVPMPGNCPEDSGPDFDFGSSPVLTEDAGGKQVLLAGQKSGSVYALDPQTGKLRWQTRVGRGGAGGGIVFGMSAQNGVLYVPITDYRAPGSNEDAGSPGIHALDIRTGRVLWSFARNVCESDALCFPGFAGVPTSVGELLFAGGDDGRLIALNARTGRLAWEFDTRQEIETVSGERAKGGALAGAVGPIAYQGMLFSVSGYGFASKQPGNVLLAFARKSKSASTAR